MMVEIALKRAYAPADTRVDGYRVLVDRLWPRGLSKEEAELDEWNKDIAPSSELRTWWGHREEEYSEFAERYRAELDENPQVAHFVELMKEHSDGRITLVYGAKDVVFNHAHVLRNYLIEATTEKTEPIINSRGFKIATIPARKRAGAESEKGVAKSTPQSFKANLEGLTLRRLDVNDAQALQWISAVTFEDTFLLTAEPRDNDDFIRDAFTLENIKNELNNDKMLHFALIDDESQEIAAFLKVNLMGAQTEDGPEIPKNSLEIQRLYVMPRFKRHKLGSFLMQKAHDIANEHNCEWLWLGVWQYNFAAQQFYTNWGFERFSEHVFAVGDDPQIDFLMKKKLI